MGSDRQPEVRAVGFAGWPRDGCARPRPWRADLLSAWHAPELAPPVLVDSNPSSVLLALGANLGDPIRQLSEAVGRLDGPVRVDAVSSVYRTEPVGFDDQPDFYNVALRGTTLLSPHELLSVAQAIEADLGRARTFPNAPRTIDIDVLAFGSLILDTPRLALPHPRLHQRAFVLVPLQEIAPEWRHPVLGATPTEMLAATGPLERVERCGELPGAGQP